MNSFPHSFRFRLTPGKIVQQFWTPTPPQDNLYNLFALPAHEEEAWQRERESPLYLETERENEEIFNKHNEIIDEVVRID